MWVCKQPGTTVCALATMCSTKTKSWARSSGLLALIFFQLNERQKQLKARQKRHQLILVPLFELAGSHADSPN